MRFSTASLALGLLPLISAAPAPIQKRALSASDTSVLQLALFLEHLELNLYTGGYLNFTDAEYTAAGFPAGFRDNVGVIASHESTHQLTIASILQENGVTPVPNCTYSFPYNSPQSFVALANMITTVGIGAYLGGATPLMDNPTLLTSASSILTVEARHDSYLRSGAHASPFPIPFDTALSAVFAYNLANQFVVSCPQPLPIILLPKLKVTTPLPPANASTVTAGPGMVLTFEFDPAGFFVPVQKGQGLYVAFINQVLPAVFAPLTMTSATTGTAVVPVGVEGVAFAVLTTFSGGLDTAQLTQFGTLAGPVEVVFS